MATNEKAHVFKKTWIKPSSILAVECDRFDFDNKLTIHLVSGLKLTEKLTRANASSAIDLLEAFGMADQVEYLKRVIAEEQKSAAAKRSGSSHAQEKLETQAKKAGKKG